jgi:hypothetical protein
MAENFGRHSGWRKRGDGFRETPPGWQRPEERISSGCAVEIAGFYPAGERVGSDLAG